MKKNKFKKDTKRILLCGYFAFNTSDNGGQPVKSREMYYALCKKYGKENINYVETMKWKHHPHKLIKDLLLNLLTHDYIIMLPAHNGLHVFSNLLVFFKMIFKKKIFYSVVGGWLPELIRSNTRLKKKLMFFNGIWVETSSMRDALEEEGFKNINIVPNFKSLPILTVNDITLSFKKPYPLCMFSRIIAEKGIEDAINAIIDINNESREIVFKLDLYGQIDKNYEPRFNELKSNFPDYIKYCGIIPPNNSVEIVKDYFALLFPTHYYTEGIPGTLIDACSAGVPVITSLWANHKDVFKECITGWGYEFGKNENLKLLLEKAKNHTEEFCSMRMSTLEESKKYRPEIVIEMVDRNMFLKSF